MNPFKFNFHFLAFLLITKNGEKQQRKPRRLKRKPGSNLPRYAQRASQASPYQAPPRMRRRTSLTFIFNLSFIIGLTWRSRGRRPWGLNWFMPVPVNRTLGSFTESGGTTKTDEGEPEIGRVPAAIRATGAPVIGVPSTPTNGVPSTPTNPFKFHY